MPDYGSATVRRRRLAAELRKLREQANLTGDDVARALRWSPSKVSRYELARTGLKPGDVKKMLDIYGVEDVLQGELLALAREATRRGWWEDYSDALPEQYLALIALEDEARECLCWLIECVPGLLQTEAYAAAVNSGMQEVDRLPPGLMQRRVDARMRRQQVLTRTPSLGLQVVLDESVLLRQVAPAPVMRAQLEYLLDRSHLASMSLQVVPLAGVRKIMAPSFTLLKFPDQGTAPGATLHDVVSTETLESTLHFQGEIDTHPYQLAFNTIVESALSPSDSLGLIADTMRRAWS
ncbi:MAG TPA: helix-turn-helix transcriptional regulator [Streptosporangiaceae bacterium]